MPTVALFGRTIAGLKPDFYHIEFFAGEWIGP